MPERTWTNAAAQPKAHRTDAFAADVCDTALSPKNVLATSFHLQGIDPHTPIPDMTNPTLLIA